MTERPDSRPRRAAAAEDATVPTIKARRDVEGCGCLDCRNVGATSVNRTVLDAVVWSGAVLRSHRPIVVLAGAIVLGRRLLETGVVAGLPAPAVGTIEAATTFVFVLLLRAYVGTIAAGELTDTPVTVRGGLRRSVARTPALVGVVALAALAVVLLPFVLSLPLVLVVAGLGGTPLETVGFPLVAAVGGVLFVLPFLCLGFKFWFAPEACVIGRYGPVESLRVSWRITGHVRGRVALVILVAVGSALGLYLPVALPGATTGVAPVPAVFDVVSSSVGDLLSVLWASAYAHVYVQSVVS